MRMVWVDYAKGIGIILVVIGHVIRGMQDAGLGTSAIFEQAYTFIYGFHMPLFFLLSGLFAAKWAERDFTTAFQQKAYTILWPYAAWSLLQGSVSIILSNATNASSLHWNNLLLKIAYLPFGQFWFLYTLFIIFMIYYVLQRFASARIVACITVAMYLAAPLGEGISVLQDLGINMLYFVTGVFLMRDRGTWIRRFTKASNLKWVTVVFVLINAAYLTGMTSAPGYILHVFKLPVACTGIVFVMGISQLLAQTKRTGWLGQLGVLSMPVYLAHILAASGTRIILSKLLHIDSVIIHLAAGMILGVTIPVCIYYAAVRLHLGKWLFAAAHPRKYSATA